MSIEIPDGIPEGERAAQPKSRLVEILQKNLGRTSGQSPSEAEPQRELARFKSLVLRGVVLAGLTRQYYGSDFDHGSVIREDGGPAMQDPDFIAFVQDTPNDTVLMILEQKKQELVASQGELEPNTDEYTHATLYLTVLDELIAEIDRG